MLKLLVLVAKGVPSDGGEYGAFRFIGFRFTKYLLVFFCADVPIRARTEKFAAAVPS